MLVAGSAFHPCSSSSSSTKRGVPRGPPSMSDLGITQQTQQWTVTRPPRQPVIINGGSAKLHATMPEKDADVQPTRQPIVAFADKGVPYVLCKLPIPLYRSLREHYPIYNCSSTTTTTASAASLNSNDCRPITEDDGHVSPSADGHFELNGCSAGENLDDDMSLQDGVLLNTTNKESVSRSSVHMMIPTCKKTRCVKGAWTPAEDRQLLDLVRRYGAQNWAAIAQHVADRSARQCRDRYRNHLDPSVLKAKWTPVEDMLICADLAHYAQHPVANQWSAIAKLLPGRTPNAIKNRWFVLSCSHFFENRNNTLKRRVVDGVFVAENNLDLYSASEAVALIGHGPPSLSPPALEFPAPVLPSSHNIVTLPSPSVPSFTATLLTPSSAKTTPPPASTLTMIFPPRPPPPPPGPLPTPCHKAHPGKRQREDPRSSQEKGPKQGPKPRVLKPSSCARKPSISEECSALSSARAQRSDQDQDQDQPRASAIPTLPDVARPLFDGCGGMEMEPSSSTFVDSHNNANLSESSLLHHRPDPPQPQPRDRQHRILLDPVADFATHVTLRLNEHAAAQQQQPGPALPFSFLKPSPPLSKVGSSPLGVKLTPTPPHRRQQPSTTVAPAMADLLLPNLSTLASGGGSAAPPSRPQNAHLISPLSESLFNGPSESSFLSMVGHNLARAVVSRPERTDSPFEPEGAPRPNLTQPVGAHQQARAKGNNEEENNEGDAELSLRTSFQSMRLSHDSGCICNVSSSLDGTALTLTLATTSVSQEAPTSSSTTSSLFREGLPEPLKGQRMDESRERGLNFEGMEISQDSMGSGSTDRNRGGLYGTVATSSSSSSTSTCCHPFEGV